MSHLVPCLSCVQGKVQGKGRLAHGGSCCHNDEIRGLQAACLPVQIHKACGYARERAGILGIGLEFVEEGVAQIDDALEIVGARGIFRNLENPVLCIVQKPGHHIVGGVVGRGQNLGAGVDERALHGLVAHHGSVKVRAVDCHDLHVKEGKEVFRSPRSLKELAVQKLFGQGLGREGSPCVIELKAGLKDDAVPWHVEILGAQHCKDVVALILVQHECRKDCLLCLLVVGRHAANKLFLRILGRSPGASGTSAVLFALLCFRTLLSVLSLFQVNAALFA